MLFEVVTIDFHYMTDRHKWFDQQISKCRCFTVEKMEKQQTTGNHNIRCHF